MQVLVSDPPLWYMADCPICAERMTLDKLQSHLGFHQEQLALVALVPMDHMKNDIKDMA